MKKLLIILVLLGVIGFSVNYAADYVIFRPWAEVAAMPAGFEEVFFSGVSDTPLSAFYHPPLPGRDTILFFHGNAGNVSYYRQFADIYASDGYGVFMFDYRGFGHSRGKLSQKHFFEDASAALDYVLKQEKIAPQHLILYAHSLGNAALLAALQTHSEVPFKAVIMQSPFTNTPDMAASFITPYPYHHNSAIRRLISSVMRWVLYNKLFNNIEKIKQIKHPVFMMYNRQDMLIPWEMSEALFQNAPTGSTNFVSPYGGHPDFAWSEKTVKSYLEARPSAPADI